MATAVEDSGSITDMWQWRLALNGKGRERTIAFMNMQIRTCYNMPSKVCNLQTIIIFRTVKNKDFVFHYLDCSDSSVWQ
jgi:hypothetical protein